MKKHLLLFAFVLATVALAGSSTHSSKQSGTAESMIYYYWFTDEELYNPTGSYLDVGSEINRLRGIWPGNVFSPYPSMGTQAYEYGYKPGYQMAIIYSDL